MLDKNIQNQDEKLSYSVIGSFTGKYVIPELGQFGMIRSKNCSLKIEISNTTNELQHLIISYYEEGKFMNTFETFSVDNVHDVYKEKEIDWNYKMLKMLKNDRPTKRISAKLINEQTLIINNHVKGGFKINSYDKNNGVSFKDSFFGENIFKTLLIKLNNDQLPLSFSVYNRTIIWTKSKNKKEQKLKHLINCKISE